MKKVITTLLLFLCAWLIIPQGQASAAARVTREPIELVVDGAPISYEGTLGRFKFDGKNVSLSGSPSYLFESICYINLAKALKTDPLASYKYNKSKRSVTVKRGQTTLVMYLDGYVAYLNGAAIKTNVKPKEIVNPNGKTYIYCPGSFVFSNLLYSYSWDEAEGTSKVRQSYETGNVLPVTEVLLSNKPVFKDTNYKQSFTLKLPEGLGAEKVRIEDDFYAGTVEIIMSGDQRQYLRDYSFSKCSRSILQISMKYRLEDDETALCLFTRTNSDGLVLLHDDVVTDSSVSLSFYRPKDKYKKIVLTDFSVTKFNKIPAVLCELGFMSNLQECSNMITDDFLYRAADAISTSVLELYSM